MHLFANSLAVSNEKKKKLFCFVLEEAEKNPALSGTAKVC